MNQDKVNSRPSKLNELAGKKVGEPDRKQKAVPPIQLRQRGSKQLPAATSSYWQLGADTCMAQSTAAIYLS